MRLLITLIVFTVFSLGGYFLSEIVPPYFVHPVSFLCGVFASIVSDVVNDWLKREIYIE